MPVMIPVNLTKRVRTDLGLRYCKAVVSANGRIKPDVVEVNGTDERHTEGSYYIEWYEGSKRKRLSVGKDAAQAQARRLRKQAELNAIAQGIEIPAETPVEDGRNINEAIAGFLEETRLTKKPKTLSAYTTSLSYFRESLPPSKRYVEDIERIDMLRFSAFLRDEKQQSPRSVYNKFENVMSFLKAQGIHRLVGKQDWPRFVEEEPEVYDKSDLDKLFKACDRHERLYFEFFLMTGMREQEVMYTEWHDVNFKENTVTVRWKPQYGFSPKNYKEREIPIPSKLTTELKAAREKAKHGCALLFPTAGCKPKLDFLDTLKRIARIAKLDPDHCWLHKFRSTFATWHLQAGVDLRTVQKWLGHTDMESTLRYLKAARSQHVREKVELTFA
jgi:integrase/recombinase XerD